VSACGGFDRGPPSPDGGDTEATDTAGGDGATLSFATDIHPVLVRDCGSCHGAGGVAAASAFHLSSSAADDHAVVVALVSMSNPAQSELLQRASGNAHGGGTILTTTSSDYQLIESWIAEGAPP
jgi:hypothetical protein